MASATSSTVASKPERGAWWQLEGEQTQGGRLAVDCVDCVAGSWVVEPDPDLRCIGREAGAVGFDISLDHLGLRAWPGSDPVTGRQRPPPRRRPGRRRPWTARGTCWLPSGRPIPGTLRCWTASQSSESRCRRSRASAASLWVATTPALTCDGELGPAQLLDQGSAVAAEGEKLIRHRGHGPRPDRLSGCQPTAARVGARRRRAPVAPSSTALRGVQHRGGIEGVDFRDHASMVAPAPDTSPPARLLGPAGRG